MVKWELILMGGLMMSLGVTHPLFFSVVLILSALTVGGVVFSLCGSWLFYSLVLVILGGMMVVILYMCVLSGSGKLGQEVKSSLYFMGLLGAMGVGGWYWEGGGLEGWDICTDG